MSRVGSSSHWAVGTIDLSLAAGFWASDRGGAGARREPDSHCHGIRTSNRCCSSQPMVAFQRRQANRFGVGVAIAGEKRSFGKHPAEHDLKHA